MLAHVLGLLNQLLDRTHGTPVAIADAFDLHGPVLGIQAQFAQCGWFFGRNLAALARMQLAPRPVDQFDVFRIADLRKVRRDNPGQRPHGLRCQGGILGQFLRTLGNAGVLRGRHITGNPGANWIQIDIGTGCQNGFFIEQGLALEAAFPESAFAVVLGIGLSPEARKGLSIAPSRQRRIGAKFCMPRWEVGRFRRIERKPATGHFLIRPLIHGSGRNAQHDMRVVAYDHIGMDAHRENLAELLIAGFDDRLAV